MILEENGRKVGRGGEWRRVGTEATVATSVSPGGGGRGVTLCNKIHSFNLFRFHPGRLPAENLN